MSAGASAAPPAATVVIAQKVRPGREKDYLCWQAEMNELCHTFPGYEAAEVVPPVEGVQRDYVVVFRFDTFPHLDRPQILPQAGFREHPAVADQHHARDREPLADLRDLRRQRLGIPGVACEHFDRDRAAVPIGQQPEDDLQLVALAIPRVAELR